MVPIISFVRRRALTTVFAFVAAMFALSTAAPALALSSWHYGGDLAAVAGAPTLSSSLPVPVAYTTPWDSTARVVYPDANGRVHELWLRPGGTWQDGGDLQSLAAVSGAATTIYAYTTPWDSTARVVYISKDGHIHELWLRAGGTWQDGKDLIVASGATVAAQLYGSLVAYVTPWDSTARVVYTGSDGHIHELKLKSGTTWQNGGDLSTQSGSNLGVNGAVTAYVSQFDSTARIVYAAVDGHIHELWSRAGVSWQNGGDLMAQANVSFGGVASSNPFGYYTSFDSTARVAYIGGDQHIHELWLRSGGTWQNGGDLLAQAGQPSNVYQGVFAYVTPFDLTARLVYTNSADGHLHEVRLTNGGVWQNGGDLSTLAGVPSATYFNDNAFAYVTPWDSTARIVFAESIGDGRSSGGVYEIWAR